MASAPEFIHESPIQAGEAVADRVRLLLVDDDAVFRKLCRHLLRRNTDLVYEVVEAEDSEDAIEAYDDGDFDCVLIDYRLRNSKGTDLMRRLQPEFDPMVPMILLTAGGGEDIVLEAMRAGAVDYLSKVNVSQPTLTHAIDKAMERARLQRSLRDRNERLQAANAALQRKNDEIRRFYHTVSHEIKTPLTAAREFISLVSDGTVGPVNGEQQELLNYAIDSCDQIAMHFDDLIESVRLEAGRMTLKKKKLPIERVLPQSVAAVSADLKKKNIELVVDIAPDLPQISVDASRMAQVFSNLLGNAVKFIDRSGKIFFRAQRAGDNGDCIEIAISDTGCGISEEHLPHIFDRLYQVQANNEGGIGVGLGLGLSIAKEIVELHGGEIAVTSALGEGTAFTLQLPIG